MPFRDIATNTRTLPEPETIDYTEAITGRNGKVGVTVRTVRKGDPDWEDVLTSWAFRQGYVEEKTLEAPGE